MYYACLFNNTRECVRDLGQDMVERALRLLDAVDSDNLEVREKRFHCVLFSKLSFHMQVEMRALLGNQSDKFLSKLQQLNLWKT